MNSNENLDLLEKLKTDMSKSGIFLNQLAQEVPFGVIKLLQRMKDANIATIGFAFSHRNVSNEIFQKFFHEGWVLRMTSAEDALIRVKALSTEQLKSSIRAACIFLNTPPKVTQPIVENVTEVVTQETDPETPPPPTRFELEEIRYNELPENFRKAAEGFEFTGPKTVSTIIKSGREHRTIRLNDRLFY